MDRRVEPEFLDQLPAEDSRAIRSRRDLQRINAWMGNVSTMARALRLCLNGESSPRLAEIGAGDGTFTLRVARRLALSGGTKHPYSSPPQGAQSRESRDENSARHPSTIVLLDKQHIITTQTQKALQNLGWQACPIQADVFDWLSQPASEGCDGIFANLFLHHFSDAQLRTLFSHVARRTRLFIAVEPRRWLWSIWFCRLLWLIGCNEVTRHDARVSIRAGFAGHELSHLWPEDGNWSLLEQPKNLSSHLFIARAR